MVLQLRQLLLNASFTIKCKCKVVKYCSVKNMHQSKSTIECKQKVLLNQVVTTKVLLNQVVITKVNILRGRDSLRDTPCKKHGVSCQSLLQGVSCEESLARSLLRGVSCKESHAWSLLQGEGVSCQGSLSLMRSLSQGDSCKEDESLARRMSLSCKESLAKSLSREESLAKSL